MGVLDNLASLAARQGPRAVAGAGILAAAGAPEEAEALPAGSALRQLLKIERRGNQRRFYDEEFGDPIPRSLIEDMLDEQLATLTPNTPSDEVRLALRAAEEARELGLRVNDDSVRRAFASGGGRAPEPAPAAAPEVMPSDETVDAWSGDYVDLLALSDQIASARSRYMQSPGDLTARRITELEDEMARRSPGYRRRGIPQMGLAAGAGVLAAAGSPEDAEASPLGTLAQRLARAQEQGFDTSRVWYHGTSQGDQIAESGVLTPSREGRLGSGVYVTPNPEEASRFAELSAQETGGAPAVLPLYRRGSQWAYPDVDHPRAQAAVSPSDLRSVNAAFDPARRRSRDLLAGSAGAGILAGAAAPEDAEAGIFTMSLSPALRANLDTYLRDGPSALSGPQRKQVERYLRTTEGRGPVARRERMRMADEVTPDVPILSRPTVDPESLVGRVAVPVMGDRSITGGVLSNVEGVPLSSPVALEGGPNYGLAQEGPVAWASSEVAARTKQSQIERAAEETGLEPIGVYTAMGDEAMKYNTMVTDALLRQIPSIGVPKRAIDSFNARMRKKFPDFQGIETEGGYAQLMGQAPVSRRKDGVTKVTAPSQLRIELATEMSKAEWTKQGFPVYDDVIRSITEPGLRDAQRGDSGFAIFEGAPGAELTPSSHGTYDTDIPGAYLGGFEQSVPVDVMFPRMFQATEGARNRSGNIMSTPERTGAVQMSGGYEVLDQEWLDRLKAAQGGRATMPALFTTGAAAGGALAVPTALERLEMAQRYPELQPPGGGRQLEPGRGGLRGALFDATQAISERLGLNPYTAASLAEGLSGAQGGIGVTDVLPFTGVQMTLDDYEEDPRILSGAAVGASVLPGAGILMRAGRRAARRR